jgi:hypothetical protein
MKFDGKRRSWEPLEDPENPCALVCRTLGTGHVVKLSPKLRDGTRCKTGALHVCVDGRCEVIKVYLKNQYNNNFIILMNEYTKILIGGWL